MNNFEIIETRVAQVRAELAMQELDAFIVPHDDEHLGEYIPAYAERLDWITGFNGSAGVAIIMAQRAALFVDGRYTVQARMQTPAELFEFLHLIENPHVQWLAEQLRQQSNGELLIKPYHSGQLGRESDTVDLTRLGALAMTRVFAGGLNNTVPQTRVLSLPYLFPSVMRQRASLDGDFGAEILRCLETRQLKGLAIYDAGARHFYAHKAIRIPSDLRAL